MGQDAIRLMYDHLLKLRGNLKKESLKVDIFIVSNGGDTAVPWRIASMIREIAGEFNVLVPYNAMSAATLLCLGADNIFMGPKGELGPVDPTLHNHPLLPESADHKKVPVSVEDVTSFIDFVKNKFGVQHEDELVHALDSLTNQVPAILVGMVNRQHSYIRMVGERLLELRKEKSAPETRKWIIESLVEGVTFHGHAISRQEAQKKLRLHVVQDHKKQKELEKRMWDLYLAYEKDFKVRDSIRLQDYLKGDLFAVETGDISLGAIESHAHSDLFNYRFKVKRKTKIVPDLKMQFQLPPGFDPETTTPEKLQKILKHLADRIGPAAKEAVIQQIYTHEIEWNPSKAKWDRIK